jgi:hypothetical protein
LNIAGTESSIKNLHVNFSFGEWTCVEPDNSQDSFDDLPTNNRGFRKARTHDEDIDAQILSAECIFNIAYKIAEVVNDM